MITRCFDQSEDADRQNKNNVTERNRSQKSPSLGDPRSGSNAIYSRRNLVCCEQKQAADRAETDRCMVWLSTDSRYSKAAVTSVPKGNFGTEEKELRNRWTEKLLTKMHFHRGKGICQNSWRKWMRYPRRLRVPSLNKIAQTAAQPSPLWEFRAANCFRDFIVASQNENPRWSGPSYLNRITGTRRSVSKGLLC